MIDHLSFPTRPGYLPPLLKAYLNLGAESAVRHAGQKFNVPTSGTSQPRQHRAAHVRRFFKDTQTQQIHTGFKFHSQAFPDVEYYVAQLMGFWMMLAEKGLQVHHRHTGETFEVPADQPAAGSPERGYQVALDGKVGSCGTAGASSRKQVRH